MSLCTILRQQWRLGVVLVTPVALGAWLLHGNQDGDAPASMESRCAFVLLTMAVYWLTESLPLPVTGLLPLALLPLLGVMSSKVACKLVVNDMLFLLMGGIIVSIAIEESGLHKRFALRILLAIGVRPTRLMLGVMATTAFLSMWISNTATTAMMIPITRALLAKLFQSQRELERLKKKSSHSGEILCQSPDEEQKSMITSARTDYNESKNVNVDTNMVVVAKSIQKNQEDNSAKTTTIKTFKPDYNSDFHANTNAANDTVFEDQYNITIDVKSKLGTVSQVEGTGYGSDKSDVHKENANSLNNELGCTEAKSDIERNIEATSHGSAEGQLASVDSLNSISDIPPPSIDDISPPIDYENKNKENETSLMMDDISQHVEEETPPCEGLTLSLPRDTTPSCIDPNNDAGKTIDDDSATPTDIETPPTRDDDLILSELSPEAKKTLTMFSLCICYSANVGGLATLTGTPTNIILANIAADLSGHTPVTFANWMGFGLPTSLLTLATAYIWMRSCTWGVGALIGCKGAGTREEVAQLRQLVEEEYRKLGRLRWDEAVVLLHFLLLVLLWLTRDPGSFTGWAVLFPAKMTSDGATAMALGISLFIWPRDRPNFFRRKDNTDDSSSNFQPRPPSIVTWSVVNRKFPWGVVFLLAGGFVIATAARTSGLSESIAEALQSLAALPTWVLTLLLTSMTSLATELTSNTVVCSLLLPILARLAASLGLHPLLLMLPSCVAASLAFMLPVATPPNALVYGYGGVKVTDMMKYGVVLNFLGVAVVSLAVFTWGRALYGLEDAPTWPGLLGNHTRT